jgi:3-dehydroquinate synthase
MNDGPATTLVTVDLGERSYNIVIGAGLIARAGDFLAEVAPARRVIIVTDENVASHWLETLETALTVANYQILTRILTPGEQTKSLEQIDALTDWVLESGVDRKTTIIALGGGVIGDLAGFAAAITLRGLPFVQIPTTLLAQVDSSVGGKTAVDTRHGKNLIGAFYQPRLVLADTDTLSTLPLRQVAAGYAEVVKYGLINDLGFFEWCEANGHAILDGDAAAARHAVEMSCRAKATIVAQDEHERDTRALLNLGHTFGHAFEAEAGFDDLLLHGEGVAFGTVCAFELSHRLELCSGQEVERVRSHFTEVGLPTNIEGIAKRHWTPDVILAHMGKDKKTEGGNLTFILPRGIGQAYIDRDVPIDTLRALLSDILPS